MEKKLWSRIFYKFDMKTKKERIVNPRKLVKGDVFRIEESNGEHVKIKNNEWFIACDNAKKLKPIEGYVSVPCLSINLDEVERRII